MRVLVGGRQVGKTTKLVQQIIAANGYDLSETFHFPPHRPTPVAQTMAHPGVHALPVLALHAFLWLRFDPLLLGRIQLALVHEREVGVARLVAHDAGCRGRGRGEHRSGAGGRGGGAPAKQWRGENQRSGGCQATRRIRPAGRRSGHARGRGLPELECIVTVGSRGWRPGFGGDR